MKRPSGVPGPAPGSEPTPPARPEPTVPATPFTRPRGTEDSPERVPADIADADTLDLSELRSLIDGTPAPATEEESAGESGATVRRSLRDRLRRPGAGAGTAAEPTPTPEPMPEPDPLSPERVRGTLRTAKRERKRWQRTQVRRFTARQRRRRRSWLIGIGAVLAVAVLAVLMAYTPIMSVREIRVEGAERVSAEALSQDLAGQLGSPFPMVDEGEIKAVLTGYPLIESYNVEARPPSTLVVRIVERRPIGVVAAEGGFEIVDAAGIVIERSAEHPAGFPLIEVDRLAEPAAFRAAAAVLRSMPAELLARVTTITATTRDDVSFGLSDSAARVLWGDDSEGAVKATLLEALMRAQPEATLYNVTSTDVGVVG